MPAPDRKAEIRRRAAEVFAKHGFDRASIRDVAKAAELSLAGLYYYYRGKDEILYDIQHEAFRTLLDANAAALAGVKSPARKLDRIIDAHLAFFGANIPQMKVMSREAEQLQGDYAKQVGELRRRYVRLVRGVLEELAKERPLRVAPDIAAFLLFGMMNWTYTWYDPKRDGTAADLADAVRGIFLKGVFE
jgi:AcrR family transcriptional regulator